MTYRELCRRLSSCGIECAENEAALLLEHFAGLSRAALLSDPDRDVTDQALEAAVARRMTREPLAYILGKWAFFDEIYTVSPDCLIPRPDTELLVELAIGMLPPRARFADLCTGSGCVAISTLCHRPDCSAVAVDLFPKTAALAQKNAEDNGVAHRLAVRVDDVLDPRCLADETLFDAILSNPPYIRAQVVDTLEPELFCEPRAALDGGEDGMLFYRAILDNFASRLAPHGLILFEIGYDQEEDITSLAASRGFSCEVKRDLAGLPRVAILYHS